MCPPSRKTLALFLAVFVPSAMAIANLRAAPPLSISLTPVDTYVTGLTAVGASEIVKFDPSTNRIFVVNAQAAAIEGLDASDLSTPIATIDVKPLGASSTASMSAAASSPLPSRPRSKPNRAWWRSTARPPSN